MKNEKMKVQYRVNEQIHAREVRIVGDDTETQVMPIAKALQIAERKGLDLVEISPNAVPPVCRLPEIWQSMAMTLPFSKHCMRLAVY